MNGVVPAQTVKLGEFAGELRQRTVDADHTELGVQIVDRADGAALRACIDPARPEGRRRRRTRLWVDELTGCGRIGLVPQLFGDI